MVPLVVRSHYSLMRGTAPVPDLCRAAAQMGYTRLALTDTNNLYGLWPFLAACKQENIIPVIGAEITDRSGPSRAVCLAEDAAGYRNLCRLITARHMDDAFSLASAMPPRAKGLTVLTDDAGLLESWRGAGVFVAAAISRYPLPRDHPLRRAARRTGAPVVAAPGSYFLNPEDFAIHRLLRAIDRNAALSRLSPEDVAHRDAWLAGPEEYARRFSPCLEMIRATYALAERLAFTGPNFGVVMPPWPAEGGASPDQALRKATYAGAKRRYGGDLAEPAVERLERELRIIADMGFSAYFLVVRDIVSRSSRICGRGSGAASLVAYCLGITNVCPLKHNLYFERFLHPGRTDPPDIDVDFAWDERDAVLNAVLEQHRDRAAMVCNHVLFQPRMAIRETAKVFGLPDREIGRRTKRLPWLWRPKGNGADILRVLQTLPETRHLDFPEPWPEILSLARRIIGAPRYLSVHSGGVVITPGPISDYAPAERAPKGVPIIQWEKDAAEDAGLVKIDLLGNRSLGVVRDALANLRKNGAAFDEASWEPEDDYATQEAVSQGNTMGCFYIESPAMRLLQRKAGVGDFAHLVIHSSIIRPAANEFIREYVRRLRGGAWDPVHPLLADVLNETFGIMVYQEDVSRAAVSMAGFSHEEADRLRKVLSKKDRERRMKDFRERFIAGARSRGVPDDKIAAVWDMMMSFSGYSFCKPHSASYARVSFQAAFLKVHFPAEFMAAVISNQGGFYSASAYVSEARRMGLTILPPDVTRSDIRWKGRGDALRVGLLSLKGLGAETMARITAERNRAPFSGFSDFLRRTRADEAEAGVLIRCGALDRFAPNGNRAALMWDLARHQKEKANACRNLSLFDDMTADALPVLPPEPADARLRREFEALGFLCDRHPITLYADRLKRPGLLKVSELPRHIGRRVCVGAWPVTGKTVRTKHGDPMEFLTFEDETGIVETTFFPDAYKRFCHKISHETPFILSGKVEQDWGAVTLTVDRAERVQA